MRHMCDIYILYRYFMCESLMAWGATNTITF